MIIITRLGSFAAQWEISEWSENKIDTNNNNNNDDNVKKNSIYYCKKN